MWHCEFFSPVACFGLSEEEGGRGGRGMCHIDIFISLRCCQKIKLMGTSHVCKQQLGLINRCVKAAWFLAALSRPRCPCGIGSLWHSTMEKVPWCGS